MIDYDDEWTAEEKLYGYHIGGCRPRERPHPYDEKRAIEARLNLDHGVDRPPQATNVASKKEE